MSFLMNAVASVASGLACLCMFLSACEHDRQASKKTGGFVDRDSVMNCWSLIACSPRQDSPMKVRGQSISGGFLTSRRCSLSCFALTKEGFGVQPLYFLDKIEVGISGENLV